MSDIANDLRRHIKIRLRDYRMARDDFRQYADHDPTDLASSDGAYLLSDVTLGKVLSPYLVALDEAEDIVAEARQQEYHITSTVLRYVINGHEYEQGFRAALEEESMLALAQYALDLRRILRSGENDE